MKELGTHKFFCREYNFTSKTLIAESLLRLKQDIADGEFPGIQGVSWGRSDPRPGVLTFTVLVRAQNAYDIVRKGPGTTDYLEDYYATTPTIEYPEGTIRKIEVTMYTFDSLERLYIVSWEGAKNAFLLDEDLSLLKGEIPNVFIHRKDEKNVDIPNSYEVPYTKDNRNSLNNLPIKCTNLQEYFDERDIKENAPELKKFVELFHIHPLVYIGKTVKCEYAKNKFNYKTQQGHSDSRDIATKYKYLYFPKLVEKFPGDGGWNDTDIETENNFDVLASKPYKRGWRFHLFKENEYTGGKGLFRNGKKSGGIKHEESKTVDTEIYVTSRLDYVIDRKLMNPNEPGYKIGSAKRIMIEQPVYLLDLQIDEVTHDDLAVGDFSPHLAPELYEGNTRLMLKYPFYLSTVLDLDGYIGLRHSDSVVNKIFYNKDQMNSLCRGQETIFGKNGYGVKDAYMVVLDDKDQKGDDFFYLRKGGENQKTYYLLHNLSRFQYCDKVKWGKPSGTGQTYTADAGIFSQNYITNIAGENPDHTYSFIKKPFVNYTEEPTVSDHNIFGITWLHDDSEMIKMSLHNNIPPNIIGEQNITINHVLNTTSATLNVRYGNPFNILTSGSDTFKLGKVPYLFTFYKKNNHTQYASCYVETDPSGATNSTKYIKYNPEEPLLLEIRDPGLDNNESKLITTKDYGDVIKNEVQITYAREQYDPTQTMYLQMTFTNINKNRRKIHVTNLSAYDTVAEDQLYQIQSDETFPSNFVKLDHFDLFAGDVVLIFFEEPLQDTMVEVQYSGGYVDDPEHLTSVTEYFKLK